MTVLPAFASQYSPYDLLPEFLEGFEAYGKTWLCPYVDPRDGLKAQAWDRGLECAARQSRIDQAKAHR